MNRCSVSYAQNSRSAPFQTNLTQIQPAPRNHIPRRQKILQLLPHIQIHPPHNLLHILPIVEIDTGRVSPKILPDLRLDSDEVVLQLFFDDGSVEVPAEEELVVCGGIGVIWCRGARDQTVQLLDHVSVSRANVRLFTQSVAHNLALLTSKNPPYHPTPNAHTPPSLSTPSQPARPSNHLVNPASHGTSIQDTPSTPFASSASGTSH
jgi:hypothetical protein